MSVAAITDLVEQGVPLEDVQRLAGHANPRTTRLYDRRQQKVDSQHRGEDPDDAWLAITPVWELW